MKKKTLAILLLAHKNTKHIVRMLNALNHPETDIYIHCDSRWDEGYRQLKMMESDTVSVIDERYQSDLDSWGLIQAAMSCIQQAKNGGYRYFALLSGQDYPIISVGNIVAELEKNYPKPYIDCTPYDKNNWIYHKFSSYGLFRRYSKWLDAKLNKSLFRTALKLPVYAVSKYVIDRVSSPKKALDKHHVDLYGGSAWWILPDAAVDYILEEYIKHDIYIEVLSKTHTPEETFFQIMSMRSPIAELIEINPKDMVAQNCKTYAYFEGVGKPFKGHPYIFTLSDKELLSKKQKSFFFARKFDGDVDSDILDYLDESFIEQR